MNALAKRFRVHRRTVRQALASPVPPGRKVPERQAPKLGAFQLLIDGWLRENLTAPKKQRMTATRMHSRLLDEHAADVSYAAVRDYVARRRREILIEAGRIRRSSSRNCTRLARKRRSISGRSG